MSPLLGVELDVALVTLILKCTLDFMDLSIDRAQSNIFLNRWRYRPESLGKETTSCLWLLT